MYNGAQDYTALTNKTVLSLVGLLLRCRNERSYWRSRRTSEYRVNVLPVLGGKDTVGIHLLRVSICCCV